MKVIKIVPPPPATTYDIRELTRSQLYIIMTALKFASGGNYERGNGYTLAGKSPYGDLYNKLAALVPHPEEE